MNKIKMFVIRHKVVIAFLSGALFTHLDGWNITGAYASDIAHEIEKEFDLEVPFL